jgi:hypothetical protein
MPRRNLKIQFCSSQTALSLLHKRSMRLAVEIYFSVHFGRAAAVEGKPDALWLSAIILENQLKRHDSQSESAVSKESATRCTHTENPISLRRAREAGSDKRRFMPPVYIPAKITAATRELLGAQIYTTRRDYNASKTRRRALFRRWCYLFCTIAARTLKHMHAHTTFCQSRNREDYF